MLKLPGDLQGRIHIKSQSQKVISITLFYCDMLVYTIVNAISRLLEAVGRLTLYAGETRTTHQEFALRIRGY